MQKLINKPILELLSVTNMFKDLSIGALRKDEWERKEVTEKEREEYTEEGGEDAIVSKWWPS